MAGAGDRDDRPVAGQNPGERQLRWRASFSFGQPAQPGDVREIARLEARHAQPRITGPQLRARRIVCAPASEIPRKRTLPAHYADRVLDRHYRIDAVNVIKIDYLGAQPLQAALARGLDVFRPAIRGWRSVWPPQIAEPAGDDVIVPAPADPPG
jgi:hypothetical protein